jgi:hypothetical protein
MVLTKFIVHSASHNANQNSSVSLSQNGEKLIHIFTFELGSIEKFSSNFIWNLCIWTTFFHLKSWSSESESSCTTEACLEGLHASNTIVIGKYIIYDKMSLLNFTILSAVILSSCNQKERQKWHAAMLSDMHHKDGTHCNTGRLDVRKFIGECKN